LPAKNSPGSASGIWNLKFGLRRRLDCIVTETCIPKLVGKLPSPLERCWKRYAVKNLGPNVETPGRTEARRYEGVTDWRWGPGAPPRPSASPRAACCPCGS
jgi:hypothetical protein